MVIRGTLVPRQLPVTFCSIELPIPGGKDFMHMGLGSRIKFAKSYPAQLIAVTIRAADQTDCICIYLRAGST